jgi:hypothetical protein
LEEKAEKEEKEKEEEEKKKGERIAGAEGRITAASLVKAAAGNSTSIYSSTVFVHPLLSILLSRLFFLLLLCSEA